MYRHKIQRSILLSILFVITFNSAACKKTYGKKINYNTLSEKYSLEPTSNNEKDYYEINASELWEMNRQQQLDAPVLIVREDCGYCHEYMQVFDLHLKDDQKVYLIDSNKMSLEDKMKFSNDYLINSVPTLIIPKDFKIYNIEVGMLNDELWISYFGG